MNDLKDFLASKGISISDAKLKAYIKELGGIENIPTDMWPQIAEDLRSTDTAALAVADGKRGGLGKAAEPTDRVAPAQMEPAHNLIEEHLGIVEQQIAAGEFEIARYVAHRRANMVRNGVAMGNQMIAEGQVNAGGDEIQDFFRADLEQLKRRCAV